MKMNDENCSFALNDYARDFFLYAYFGIITKKLKAGDKTIEADTRESAALKCAYRAYLDMCRTLNYMEKNDPNRSFCIKCICSKIASILCSADSMSQKRVQACNLFSDDKQVQECFIDKLEPPTASDASQYVNSNGKRSFNRFYYGQAQKWINMTIKYMWLIGILGEAREGAIDVPIDSLVMKAAYSDFQMDFPRDNKTYNIAYYKLDPKAFDQWQCYSKNATMPWSKLEKSEYDHIQNCIRDNSKNNPLIWECDAWIAQAAMEAIDSNDWRFAANKEKE